MNIYIWNAREAFPNLKKVILQDAGHIQYENLTFKRVGEMIFVLLDEKTGNRPPWRRNWPNKVSYIRIDASAKEVKIAGDIDLLMPKFMGGVHPRLVQEVYNLKNILFN